MRIKTIMLAPVGAIETVIGGQPYEPDEEGHIEVFNPNDIAVLKLHGYVLVSQHEVAPRRIVAPKFEQIEIEELGRSGLAAALIERGVPVSTTATRDELVAQASTWNAGRKPVAPAAPAAPATAPRVEAPQAPSAGDGQDFSKVPYQELRGWLVSRGAAVSGQPPKATLVALAQQLQDKAKAEAPADVAEAV